MNVRDARVVFMGSPSFAVPSLQALVGAGYQVVAAVTQPAKPAGRGGAMSEPAIKSAASALGVPVLQPPRLKDPAVEQALTDLQPDVFVVAAYGKLLPQALLDIPKRGCVNVHASLLPRWRGASPITAAILAGDRETGVSIMEMALAMDAGPVIRRASMAIEPGDTAGSLEPRLAELGAHTLVLALPAWYDRKLNVEAQDEDLVTVCQLLSKSDGHLRAATTAEQAERAVRAYDPWPGASVGYAGGRLAIWRVRVESLMEPRTRGEVFAIGKEPAIALRDGALVLEEVQKPGGHRISGKEFMNGLRGVLPPNVGLA